MSTGYLSVLLTATRGHCTLFCGDVQRSRTTSLFDCVYNVLSISLYMMMVDALRRVIGEAHCTECRDPPIDLVTWPVLRPKRGTTNTRKHKLAAPNTPP